MSSPADLRPGATVLEYCNEATLYLRSAATAIGQKQYTNAHRYLASAQAFLTYLELNTPRDSAADIFRSTSPTRPPRQGNLPST
jgi:hypothetical protein